MSKFDQVVDEVLGFFSSLFGAGEPRPSGSSSSPASAPPTVPKGKKPCEPADTWFDESAKSHRIPRAQWDRLSCKEKQQVMGMGPLAINSIAAGRAYEELKKLGNCGGCTKPGDVEKEMKKAGKKLDPRNW